MTPDQVYHRLCDRAVLKSKGGRRVSSTSVEKMTVSEGGVVKGRTADGTPIEAKVNVGGKSLARRLMEAAKERKEAEQQTRPRRGRRNKT